MRNYRLFKCSFTLISLLFVNLFAQADTSTSSVKNSDINAVQRYADIISDAQLTEVANTLTEGHIKSILLAENIENFMAAPSENTVIELKSAALLKKLGCIKKIVPIASITFTECNALAQLTLLHPSVPEDITSPLNFLLRNNVIQGYNVKQNNLAKHSNTSELAISKQVNNTLLYGHSSLIHAKQLVALLKVHNVNFTWQLIEKTSAFNIRDGWKDTIDLEKSEKIRYAQEYDVLFTFADHQNKLKFMPLVSQYAKLNESSSEQDKELLIIDAWWQPFYRSFIDEKNYKQVTRINMISEKFTASTLALNADKYKVLSQIESLLSEHSSSFTVSTEHIWVNPAFYRYLNGQYQ